MRETSLPILFILIPLLFPTVILAGQSNFTSNDTSAHPAALTKNSGSSTGADSTYWTKHKKISISITPDSAAGASITIIKRSKIESAPDIISIFSVPPDTLGTWKAPLSMVLFQGDYDFIATRPGFRRTMTRFRLDYYSTDSLSMKMYSLAYLSRMRKQWGRYKWISAGVAVGAGIATWFFYSRIGSSMNRYNSAATVSAIQADQNSVRTSQSLYTISSVVAFTAVGSYLVTWIIQGLYHK